MRYFYMKYSKILNKQLITNHLNLITYTKILKFLRFKQIFNGY